MKSVIAAVLLVFSAATMFGQGDRVDFDLTGYGVNISADKRLIIVRTTLELANIQTDLSDTGKLFRTQVLEDFKDFNPDLRSKLRIFVEQYKRRNPNLSAAEVSSPFISMAYTLSPVPELAEPRRSAELPGTLLEVLDYSPLVREFYRSPGVPAKIDEYFEEYQEYTEVIKPSTREMVRDLLDYLHTRPRLSYVERTKVESGEGKKKLVQYETVEHRRVFTIVHDLLAAKGNINFLNIRDEYFAIIPPNTTISSSEVRRAYLQFVLDPLVINQSREIFLHQTAIKTMLAERRKTRPLISPDPFLAVSRSLVAAADIREEEYRKAKLATEQAIRKIDQMKTDEDKKEVADELQIFKQELADEALLHLVDSYENGAVFAFYFAEKLDGVEQSGFDIAGSIKDWIFTLSPDKEAKRLETTREAAQKALLARETRRNQKATSLVENPLTQALIKVDDLVEAKDFAAAEKDLVDLLDDYEGNDLELARIFYSLGRMKSLQAENATDPEVQSEFLVRSSNYYKTVLQRAMPTERALRSSTYFALGKIYEHFDQDDYALKIYDLALSIGYIPGGAFEEAFEAKKNILVKIQKKTDN